MSATTTQLFSNGEFC